MSSNPPADELQNRSESLEEAHRRIRDFEASEKAQQQRIEELQRALAQATTEGAKTPPSAAPVGKPEEPRPSALDEEIRLLEALIAKLEKSEPSS